MTDKLLKEIKERLDCLILLSSKSESPEKEKLKIVSNCLGMSGTAKLLGKDLSNFSKYLKGKGTKKNGKKENK